MVLIFKIVSKLLCIALSIVIFIISVYLNIVFTIFCNTFAWYFVNYKGTEHQVWIFEELFKILLIGKVSSKGDLSRMCFSNQDISCTVQYIFITEYWKDKEMPSKILK